MKHPTITEAAKLLNVSRTRVFALLRSADILGSRDLAHSMYCQHGYFVIEQRDWNTPGTTIQHQYAITTVTPKGLALIQDLIDADEAPKCSNA